jgi:predicted nucleic acid-binding protein
MFILDTDVLSNLRKAKKHPGVQAWVEGTGWQLLCTTVVAVAEIQCGIQRQMKSDPVYGRATQEWLDNFLEIGEPQVFTLTVRASLLLARMHETPSLRNFITPDPRQKDVKTAGDLAIAAIAIVEGAVIATRNHKHFEEIDACFPLPGLYNPFEDHWSRKPAAPGFT